MDAEPSATTGTSIEQQQSSSSSSASATQSKGASSASKVSKEQYSAIKVPSKRTGWILACIL